MDLPVTVIGGYLGAGKTTLVNHLLRHNEGLRLAVLVNEFGALSIDEDLIEAEADGLKSISGGCVCCAYGSDLIGVLDDLAAADPPFDHVLIEASGVALPASIAVSVGMVRGLRSDGIVVLADAEQIRANAANTYLSDTIDRQLSQADIVLLTKRDLVSDDAAQSVTDWLRTKKTGARILPVSKGQVPPGAVLGALPFPARGHRPDTGPHADYASVLLQPDPPVDAKALAMTLATDPAVIRAKGFVETETGLALVHVVGHRHETEPARGEHPTGIVCIGLKRDLDADRLAAKMNTDAELGRTQTCA